MSFIDNVKSLFGARSREIEQKSGQQLPSKLWKAMIWAGGWENFSRWPKEKLITQAYERNPAFYSACNIIAQTVADIPVYVDAKKNGRIVQTTEHPILKTMELTESRTEFIERLTLYLVATGESYAQITFSQRGKKRPLGLIVVPSQYMNPIMGDYVRPVSGFRYTETNQIDFGLDEIIYIKKPSLSEYWHGMSSGVATAELVDLFNAGVTWNKNIALAGGVPPVIATAPSMLPEEQQEAKEKWRSQRGANNSHELTIISGNLEIKPLHTPPHDAEWEKAIMVSMRMILMSFGVSSELLNDAGNKTYSNYREARKALYMEASIPMARKIYGAITKQLSKYYEDSPVIRLDVDRIESIQEDRGFAAERLTRMVDAGIITPNEAREELGYSRKDGGDVLRRYLSTPSNEQPNVGEENEEL
jgi:HK97 family phage portal protein